MTKTARKTTPGLARLRKAPAAEAIRSAVLADQTTGRRKARARIDAQTAKDAPAAVAAPKARRKAATPATARPAKAQPHFTRGVPVAPTPVPTPAQNMAGMSRANAELYLAAAEGRMPTPPDFSKPSYAPDRKRLAELVALAEAGDAAGLRAYSVRVYYSAALELDRFRHRCIIALEARARQAA